ncbi:MAG: LysM peptidoglycan-binding domain-containing protein [Bacteroidales bacterium]|nr:LysM peptidoglycan-binding domain-containing protein [Bacteroidales bacterium]
MDRIKISRMITVVALLLTFAAAAGAQEYVAPPVEVSDQKVKKDGKVYYSHVVQERQTLYSISKAYNVTQDEILEANHGLRESGLKKNSIIMIPVQSEAPAMKDIPQQETVESVQEPIQEPAQPSLQKIHVVRWYETLKDIADRYNVSESAIIAANKLKDGKIKNRQKLIIPTEVYAQSITPEMPAEEKVSEEEEDNMDLETAFDNDDNQEEATQEYISKSHIQATVLLPLKATGSTSSKSNMDFYSGVLLAAREMGESGVDIDMSVYDIANGSYGATKSELESSDIIIGPVAAADITRIYAVAPGIKALISPLDPKAEQLCQTYSTMIHAPASRMAQYEDLAQWIKEDLMPGDRVIVISEKEARKGDEGKLLRAAIDSAYIEYIPLAYSILEGRKIQEPLEAKMTAEGTNRVIIASESEAFVNDAVRNLNLTIHNKFKVVLYAPAKIRTFETIEIENFHNTNLHASLTYYIDYSNADAKQFVKKYRALFNTEPTQFAFQGYDVAKYFIGLCAKYGDAWMHHTEDTLMLQSTFNIKPVGNGYINNGIRRIVYGPDYSVMVVE